MTPCTSNELAGDFYFDIQIPEVLPFSVPATLLLGWLSDVSHRPVKYTDKSTGLTAYPSLLELTESRTVPLLSPA